MVWAALGMTRALVCDSRETLVRVVAPYFVAGLVLDGNTVVAAAPILKWAIGQTRARLRTYFAHKRWTATVIRQAREAGVDVLRTGQE